MMIRFTAILSLLGFLFIANLSAQNSADIPPEVSISGTQQLNINSSIANKDYTLYVNLPSDYGDTTKVFPVVYLLDAQWDFTLMQSIFGQQYFDGFIPQMVVVGITWGGSNPNCDSLRRVDFTPTSTEDVPFGGHASKFLQFIKKELIPFIESKYRVKNSDRTLVGTSLGGIFSLYAMMNETSLFKNYVLTSPALNWDNDVMFKYEKEFAPANKKLPIKLYIGIGEYEDAAPLNRFVNVLKARNYAGLNLKTRVLEGVGHSGSKPLGYTWGMQFAFARPAINVSSALIKKYAGFYKGLPKKEMRLYVDKSRLVFQDTDDVKSPLFAETKDDFYVKGALKFIHFKTDNSGKIIGFRIKRYGETSYAKLVKQ
jgi:predicted alpha/beta superfamily hydrolase